MQGALVTVQMRGQVQALTTAIRLAVFVEDFFLLTAIGRVSRSVGHESLRDCGDHLRLKVTQTE